MEKQDTNLPSVRADSPDINDKLGFAPYANTISQIILDKNVETPLTIGIFGSWGSGKTTLMRMVEAQINAAALRNPERLTLPIWFNAWLYSKEDVLWRALLAQVVTAVGQMDIPSDPTQRQEKNKKLEALKVRLYRKLGARELGSLSFDMADLLQSSGSGAQLTLTLQQGFDLVDKVVSATAEAGNGADPQAGEDKKEQLKKMATFRKEVQQAATELEQGRLESLDKFRTEFDDLMREYVSDEGYLVVFVDDLDRCLPEKAVEVLEAIKLFLDVKGCIFILAIDQGVVERGIQLRYRELGEAKEEDGQSVIDGGRYLEKIVQIPFMLPPISPRTMGQYIASLAPDLDRECGNVFAQGLEANPRHVKRALNIFSLLWRLAQNKPELTTQVDPVRLAKLVVLQQQHEELYELLRKNPARLREWETVLRNVTDEEALRQKLGDGFQDDKVKKEELQSLRGLLTMHDQTLADMNFADLEPDKIHAYVYLASAVEDTTQPGQPDITQTAVPPIPQESLAKELGEDLLEGEEREVVLEEPRASIVPVHSPLDEARLSFVTATVFRDIEKQLMQFDAPFDRKEGMKMADVLGAIGWQLYDQIFSPDVRMKLEMQLEEPTQLLVAQGRGQGRIPWEIMYDGPPPSSSQPLRKVKQPLETADFDAERFWGFKHIIERPKTGPDLIEAKIKQPLLLAYIGSDTPQAATVNQDFNGGFKFELGHETLRSPEDFFKSLNQPSGPPRIYLLRTHVGIEQGETWIGFGFEETTRADLSNLYELLNRYFSLSELEELAFDLEIDFENIPGETRPAKARELVLYLERRNQISRLVELIRQSRPNADLESVFSPNLIRLTRRQLESQSFGGEQNAILLLDVDKALVQAEDWTAWLGLFYRMGFAGVVAPTIAPDLARSWHFIQELLQGFSSGASIGEVLRQARHRIWLKEGDPSGLFYAHFGPANLQIMPEEL